MSGDGAHHVLWGEVTLRMEREQDEESGQKQRLNILKPPSLSGMILCWFPVTHSLSFVSFLANASLKAQDPHSVAKNAVSLVCDTTVTTLTGEPVSPVFPGFPAGPGIPGAPGGP